MKTFLLFVRLSLDRLQFYSLTLPVPLLLLSYVSRLESGNSIEEKLLKNGTKDLIREVAAQGTDYTLAFLTQVRGFPSTHVVFFPTSRARRGNVWNTQQLTRR